MKTYTPGYDDPTPEDLPDEDTCGAEGAYGYGRYFCTWERGHEGSHVAGDGDVITHVWPNVCGATKRVTATDMRFNTYSCTRGQEHEGDHITQLGGEVLTTWASKKSITPADIAAAIESIQKEMRK